MSEIEFCGQVAKQGDGIERITLVTIRYMALVGEAMSKHLSLGHRALPSSNPYSVFAIYFDRIEHVLQDALEGIADASKMAGLLMDNITVMKLTLNENGSALGDGLVMPTIAELQALYTACQKLGGHHLMQAPAF